MFTVRACWGSPITVHGLIPRTCVISLTALPHICYMYLLCLTVANLLASPNCWVPMILPLHVYTYTLSLSVFFLRPCVYVCVDMFPCTSICYCGVDRACVCVCYMFFYLCVSACTPCDSLESMWMLLSPRILVVCVPVLWEKRMFRDSAVAAYYLFYHRWSSADMTHKGFITIVMVSINHIYCALWDTVQSHPVELFMPHIWVCVCVWGCACKSVCVWCRSWVWMD